MSPVPPTCPIAKVSRKHPVNQDIPDTVHNRIADMCRSIKTSPVEMDDILESSSHKITDGTVVKMEEAIERNSHRESASPNHKKDFRRPITDIPGAMLNPEPRQGLGGLRNDVLSKLGIVDPTVDPSNPTFDFDIWSCTIANLRDQLGVPTPPRSEFFFRRLTVRGSGPAIGYQDTVWTSLTSLFDFRRWSQARERKPILQGLDGVVQKGELLLVLGRPGSGCTTFLKAVTGQTLGLELDPESVIEYSGIPHSVMTSRFKGELIYAQEVDQHLPYLTVGQTLEFTAGMRTPRTRLPGVTRPVRIKHAVEVMLVAFGLSQVRNTIVGDDYVRGVSGGERKRVSIAEAALAEVAVSAWDNSTRGLDSGSSLRFVHRLRPLPDLTKSCTAAALYQSSQAIFDRFYKVLVLYQGRQIFFGPAPSASEYFEQMGWCRFEGLVPETPEEFEKYWRESPYYASLQAEMDRYRQDPGSRGDAAQRELNELLFVFVATLGMSMVFRTVAAATKTLAQAMAVAGFLTLTLVTYTGFVLPVSYMRPWFKWISFINPLIYSFEALLANEAHGTRYPCVSPVPPYRDLAGKVFVCPVPGALAGQAFVSGDAWFEQAYGYSYSHLWRNLWIILGFMFFFLFTYVLATEVNAESFVDPGVLVFPRGSVPGSVATVRLKGKGKANDIEALGSIVFPVVATRNGKASAPASHGGRFLWRNVCLDVKVKEGSRRLLDDVSGWVRPGTLTALMGESGAGKTALLNALAQRLPSDAAHGEFRIGGKPISASFKSDVAYVQQQDVHLETSTVREVLQFSAMLRQGVGVPKSEKLACVEDIIGRLSMEDFADAVVGVPGKGLNLEQRKRLSIDVELAAKPSALLLLDEPTSGLDSQASETIVALLRKLAAGGLSMLCTIHQPSAMRFQQFDRLLLMAPGGRTAYFGGIGENSETVLRYFGRHGLVRRCADAENPAEYLLDVIGATDATTRDWPRLWNESAEAKSVSGELERMMGNGSRAHSREITRDIAHARRRGAYTVALPAQFPIVCLRVFQQYGDRQDTSSVNSRCGLSARY
ncbi:hypothetical protein DL771_004080 [Monosporascus sp. 5C6A]|nr:hypothetical protein DL771_004080 [Monosporascus sp. 5C6A]